MRIGPFGIWEILIILVIVLLIFGPKRLPEMAKGLGQSVRAFRKEMRDIKSDLDFDDKSAAAPANPTVTAASQPAASSPAAAPEPAPQAAEAKPTRDPSGA